jgi:hypothetical protein
MSNKFLDDMYVPVTVDIHISCPLGSVPKILGEMAAQVQRSETGGGRGNGMGISYYWELKEKQEKK